MELTMNGDSVETHWIDQAMDDGAVGEQSRQLIHADMNGKLQALEEIVQNVCRDLKHTSSEMPDPTKAEHMAITTLFAATNEDAALGAASLAFKRLVHEVEVEAVKLRAIDTRIFCKTIVEQLPAEIRNMIYRMLLPHGDQHEPLDETLVLDTGPDLRYTDIGQRLFKSISYWPDNTKDREIMGQPMHEELTSEFHHRAKFVLTNLDLRWLAPTVACDAAKIRALSRVSDLILSLLLTTLSKDALDEADVSSCIDHFFRIIRPLPRSVTIRLSAPLPWTSDVVETATAAKLLVDDVVKYIDATALGDEKDNIRVQVLSGWPGGIAPEMALDTTVGEHLLASAKVE